MKNKIILISIIVLAFLLARYLNITTNSEEEIKAFSFFKDQIDSLKSLYLQNKIIFIIFLSIIFYLLNIAFIPFIGPFFVLLGGALLGPVITTILFSFLVSISYTSSFLIVRTIFIKIHLLKKFNKKFEYIVKGFEKDGWVYLLSVRLAAVIPAIAINIGMGLTRIPTKHFYFATQVGTLPIIVVYSYAGSQIQQFKSFNDLITPDFLLIMLFIAISPIVLKLISELILKKHPSTKKKIDK
ncbi:VTT domain-containing protein [Pigmentibacter sp. JX0631]|uniref:TVP38/TMEM64 family protein n=1 Tax=Pigmentibacter sp. JX0631 TaxID=2976982 RepID=UPI002468E78E|nr:VTT domain-containing protein [Pigmentibacter sp. JX0631]WGL60869.1 VTT domain-containing protein [Pigmentibacter sp. JX0631]